MIVVDNSEIAYIACAEKITSFSLPHQKPWNKTDKQSKNGKRFH